MAMSDEEREARAEARAKALRAERIKTVWTALSAKKRKTSRQLSKETGYSKRLVLSTINLIRRQTDDRGGSAIAYDPRTHEFWIAATWDQHAGGIEWLRRHLTTRARSLNEFMDVAAGLWPSDVPISMLVGIKQIEAAVQSLEDAIQIEHEKARLKADRGVNLRG